MSKKNAKHAANSIASDLEQANAVPQDNVPAVDTAPKKERAPRISRPRFFLVSADGKEIRFTHYALPTRRQPAGKVNIGGTEVDFVVTKSQSKDKTENRAYSYLTLPNGATGYVTQELSAGVEFSLKELPPAEPFGGKKGAEAVAA